MVEGQGGPGHVMHCNPSAGLSWSVGTDPEAPLSVPLVFHLCAGDSDNGQQRWVQLGVPWLPFPDSPSHSLTLPTLPQQERWGGNALAQDQGQSPEVPALLSSGANSLGVLGSARDLWCPCSIFGVDSGRLIPLPFTGICPISPAHPQLS